MNYKIILDTNIVWLPRERDLKWIFSTAILDLKKFILDQGHEKDVKIFIPEVVFHERLTHRTEDAVGTLDCLVNDIESLKVFGLEALTQRPNIEQIRETLEKLGRDYLKENSIDLLLLPELNLKYLAERAYKKVKPFSKEDKGFKDTLIWMSILEDAKIKDGEVTYVLCTDNLSDFDIKSLRQEIEILSGAKLEIYKNVQDIKTYLDEQLKLNLTLQQLYEEIKKEVLLKIGEITLQFNQQILAKPSSRWDGLDTVSYNPLTYTSSLYDTTKKRTIIGYDFNNISITNTVEVSKNMYEITAILTTIPRYENASSEAGLTPGYAFVSYLSRSHRQEYNIDLIYNRNSKKIELKNNAWYWG